MGAASRAALVEVNSTVRMASEDDAVALAELINRAYEVEKFFIDGDRITAQEVREHLDEGFFLVLDRSEGGLAAATYVKPGDDVGYFGLLSVDPVLQGRGLGRRLVALAEAMCQAQGCTEIHIKVVNLRTELTPWYRSLGYRQVGTMPFVPGSTAKQACHFIQMAKSL